MLGDKFPAYGLIGLKHCCDSDEFESYSHSRKTRCGPSY